MEDQERQRLEQDAAEYLADLDGNTAKALLACGISKRELKATRSEVPEAIKRAMPRKVLEDLLDGRLPAGGFGIGGNVGGGKSCALVAILKLGFQADARRCAPTFGRHAWEGYLAWSNWPDEVNRLRTHALDPATTERLEWLENAPLLVLDDLGRERIRGSYVEDNAANKLDVIINARHREERPILWTTNCTEGTLVDLYGGALWSRLDGDNPLVWVDGLKDMRRAR